MVWQNKSCIRLTRPHTSQEATRIRRFDGLDSRFASWHLHICVTVDNPFHSLWCLLLHYHVGLEPISSLTSRLEWRQDSIWQDRPRYLLLSNLAQYLGGLVAVDLTGIRGCQVRIGCCRFKSCQGSHTIDCPSPRRERLVDWLHGLCRCGRTQSEKRGNGNLLSHLLGALRYASGWFGFMHVGKVVVDLSWLGLSRFDFCICGIQAWWPRKHERNSESCCLNPSSGRIIVCGCTCFVRTWRNFIDWCCIFMSYCTLVAFSNNWCIHLLSLSNSRNGLT